MRRAQRNPKAWVIAAVVSSAIAAAVGVYNAYATQLDTKENDNDNDISNDGDGVVNDSSKKYCKKGLKQKKYTNKSIALTLLHSILSLPLPLNEILLNSENVTFILPPNLSLDDLQYNIDRDVDTSSEDGSSEVSKAIPKKLLQNYKLLKSLNLQGYLNIVKNLRPDMLLVCSDDLGIQTNIPGDFDKFVKEIVNLAPNRDEIYSKVLPLFIK